MAAERLLSSFLSLLPGSRGEAPGRRRPRGRAWAWHLAAPAGARGAGGSFGGLAPPGRRARRGSWRSPAPGAAARPAPFRAPPAARARRAEESRGEQAWLGDPRPAPPRATRRGPARPPPRRRPIRHEEASLAGGPLALLVLPGGSQWQETSRPAGASTWPRPPSPASPEFFESHADGRELLCAHCARGRPGRTPLAQPGRLRWGWGLGKAEQASPGKPRAAGSVANPQLSGPPWGRGCAPGGP